MEQLRQCRLEGQGYKEQLAGSQQQLQQQALSLQLLQQQHQQLLDQACQQSQAALQGTALHLHQHEGAALDQVGALAVSTAPVCSSFASFVCLSVFLNNQVAITVCTLCLGKAITTSF